MIELNATFFVQMVHFFIAWGLLDRFFFRPVVALIQKKRRDQKKAEQAIDQVKDSIEAVHHKQELLIKRYKKQFKEESPVVQVEPALSYTAVLCPHSEKITPKNHEKLLEETEHLLLEKVSQI